MPEIKTYHLPPTPLIPNSPLPLLHYVNTLPSSTPNLAVAAYDLFTRHGWRVQWMVRYGPTQKSHYHTSTHECMAVVSGEATIRFGVADTTADLEASTYGSGREDGGVDILARPGDVFVIPAGVAHKTYGTRPVAEFEFLTPGDGHRIEAAGDEREVVASTPLEGFTMIGAYPPGGEWDWAFGGENQGAYQQVWEVEKPEMDPVMGMAEEGLVGLWR